MEEIKDMDLALRAALGAGRRGPLPGLGRGPGRPWEGIAERTPQVWATWLAEWWRMKTGRPLPERPPVYLTFGEQVVRLVGVPRPFGHEWQFVCPGCGGKRRVLYLVRRGLLCRKCARLGYLAQARRGGKDRALDRGLPLWGRYALRAFPEALAEDLGKDFRKALEALFSGLKLKEVGDEEGEGEAEVD